jgi:RHS repeat-associated protein
MQVTKVTASGSNGNTVLTTYTYDSHNEKIQSISQKYNSQAPVTTASYGYNEIGQLVTRQLGYNATTMAYLQMVDYRYNIRGQLLTINNSTLANDNGATNNDNYDLFGMTYLYDGTDPSLANDHPSYTGRISAVKWMYKYTPSGTTTATASNERSYVYRYDQLGQLISSLYAERLPPPPNNTSTTPFTLNLDGFDEKSITYDDDGNITALQRYASTTNGLNGTALDRLKYSYDPNNPDRLLRVADTVTTTGEYGFNNTGNINQANNYQYDADGNLKEDPYKNILLTYNLINKTSVISAPSVSNSTINYTYDAAGTVLEKQIYNGASQTTTTTDYIDEFVYTNGVLGYFQMPEGRVVSSGGTFKPEYVITDQQGNARFSFQDNGSGSPLIIQENSFYGFGEVMPGSLVNLQPAAPPNAPNNNIYNGGSEWQNAFGNLPDYYQSGSRNYDPELGRFISVDPMADMTESLTNYHYALNNPIMGNDPSGNCDPTSDDGCDVTLPPFEDPDPTDTDTGGGGGGDPDTDYLNGVATDNSTDYGTPYNGGYVSITTTTTTTTTNNTYLGITTTTTTVTTSSSYSNGDGNTFVSYSSVTYYTRSQLTFQLEGTDLSTLGLPNVISGTIPNADVTVGAQGAGTVYANATSNEANQGGGEIFPGAAAILGAAAYSYPPNDGFVGTPLLRQTVPGEILTRYGGTRPVSEYFSPPGATYDQRYLPPETDQSIYQEWRVLKPFDIMEGPIAGPDGLPTGGIQYRSLIPYAGLTQPGNGYIEPVEPSTWQIIEDIAEKYFEEE